MDGGLGTGEGYEGGTNGWSVMMKSDLILGSGLEMYEETTWESMCLEESCTTSFSVFNDVYVRTGWAWFEGWMLCLQR